MIETIATAAAAFVATNVDDLVVLSVLFARRDEQFGGGQIVAGQFLGFSVLVAASLAVGVGLLALPDAAVGALGLMPVGLGVRGIIRARRHRPTDSDDDARSAPRVMTTTGVASITIANGADNIAIYAPLFATIGADSFVATVVVFTVLVAVWCLLARVIGGNRAVAAAVAWAGEYAIPVVLIALGIWIIARSGVLGAVAG